MHYNGKGNDKALWDLEMEILWGVFEKGAVHPFKTSINQNDEWVKFDQIMYDKDHTSKTSEEWKTAILNCGVENIFLIDEESNKQTYGISNEKGEFIVDFKFSVQPQNGDKNGRMHLATINAEYYNNKNNFDMAKKYTKSEIEGMIKNLKEKEKKARSKWGKAVLQDAQWLLENVIELMQGDEINEVEITEKYLLNGAENWEHFSDSGDGLVYEVDIAKHYCTPSQLKKFGYDEANESIEKQPSDDYDWYDVQARALRQAWWAIRDEMNGTTEFSMSLCEFEGKEGESNFDLDDSNKDDYWGELVNYGIATDDELQLVTDINGYTIDTLDDVLYARTGNRSWEQYCDENDIENIFDDDDDDTEFSMKSNFEIVDGMVLEIYDKNGKLANTITDERSLRRNLTEILWAKAQKMGKSVKIGRTYYDKNGYERCDIKQTFNDGGVYLLKGVPTNWGYLDTMKIGFSIIDDTKDVLKATGKLAGNIVKNTTDKGGLLMF